MEKENQDKKPLLLIAFLLAAAIAFVGYVMDKSSHKSTVSPPSTYASSPDTSSKYGSSYNNSHSTSGSTTGSTHGVGKDYSSASSPVYNPNYKRTQSGYDSNAPLMPRDKGDIEPLYNEVQRRKELYGVSDEEAVKQIVEEYEDAGEP